MFSFVNFSVRADHFAAGEATFVRNPSNGNYIVTVRMYEACAGTIITATIAPSVTITSSLGTLSPVYLTLNTGNIISNLDITPVCTGLPSNCISSDTGTMYGVREFIFQSDEVTLSSINPGEDYIINVCGSTANFSDITTGAYVNDYEKFFVSTKFKPQTSTGQIISNVITPSFPDKSFFYVCANEPTSLNLGLGNYDSEGDLYEYSLVAPKGNYKYTSNCEEAYTSNFAYSGSYSATNPMGSSSGVQLSTDGILTFTPNVIDELALVTVLVREHREPHPGIGDIISETIRNIEIKVLDCTQINNAPPVITSIADQTICAGTESCIYFSINEPDNDIITVEVTGITNFTLRNVNSVSGFYDADLCWTPTINDVGTKTVTVTAKDRCITGNSSSLTFQIFVYSIINPSSVTICRGESITLTTSGTGPFLWSTGATTTSINVTPNITTIYTITDNVGCQGLATVNVSTITNPDLWMKDKPADDGYEPGAFSAGSTLDMWNRLLPDGGTEHQPPDYSAINHNYIYVKVRNRGCQASLGTEKLYVYWTIMSTANSWPTYWENYVENGKIKGHIIETTPKTIPIIPGGSFTIIEIPWDPKSPAYYGLTEYDVCLLARVETTTPNPLNILNPYGMAVNEESNVTWNAINNNNIIMKNIHVVDEDPGNTDILTGDVLCDVAKSYNFLFNVATDEVNQPFTANGIVNVDLGKAIYDKWVKGGRKGSGFQMGKFNHMSATGILHHHSLQHFPYTLSPYTISITENPETILENIQYEPCERLPIQVSFNYFPQLAGAEKKEFNYDVIQTKTEDNSEIGLVRFEIHRPDCVTPIASVDQTIGRGCKTLLTASSIENGATYTWYDNATGSFIAQGSFLEVSPENATTYELQMASANGCIAYDLVTVTVDLDNNSIACIPAPDAWGCFREEKIEPNPAGGNDLHVKFFAEERGNINISLANTMGRVLKSENLKVEQGPVDHVMSLRTVPIGVYRIIIKCKEKVREMMVTRL